jgi:hypothetical protein
MQGILRTAYAAITSECFVTRELAESGENDDIVPEGKQLSTESDLAKPGF